MPKGPQITLQIGDPAPAFEAPSSGGGTVSLKQFRGKNVVLYFYPKDDTPGCTTEACGFRDAIGDFTGVNAVVLGVSPDSAKSHDQFVAKFNLPFTLVADSEHRIAEAYGVWGEKKFMGRTYQGVHRASFLIGPDGAIRAIWPVVKPADHPAEVLAALRAG